MVMAAVELNYCCKSMTARDFIRRTVDNQTQHLRGAMSEREGTPSISEPACHVSVFEKASVWPSMFLRDVLDVKIMVLFIHSGINNGVIYYSGPGILRLGTQNVLFISIP